MKTAEEILKTFANKKGEIHLDHPTVIKAMEEHKSQPMSEGEAISILKELVRLKGIKDRRDAYIPLHERDEMNKLWEDYCENKPKAWERARQFTAGAFLNNNGSGMKEWIDNEMKSSTANPSKDNMFQAGWLAGLAHVKVNYPDESPSSPSIREALEELVEWYYQDDENPKHPDADIIFAKAKQALKQ